MVLFSEQHEESLGMMRPELRSSVIGALLLYVFRGTDQSEIRSVIKGRGIDFDFLSWRRHLHRNGALLRNGKIFVYHKACGLSPSPKEFELSKRESLWLSRALEFKPLERRLRFLIEEEARPPLCLKSFDNYAGSVLSSEDFVTYVKKYVAKKMAFLRASYNVTFHELQSDLYSWSHYALLRAYPRFDDEGHGIAIAKTIAKRRGVNLIKSLTAQKNDQLITHADGTCERTSVSLSSVSDGTGQFLTADGTFIHRSLLVVGMNGLSSAASSIGWDTLYSLKELTKSSQFTSTQRRFLSMMIGNHDAEFSEYLGVPNEDALSKMDYAVYKRRVCQFLSLPEPLANRFLSNLRAHLGGTPENHIWG